MKHAVDIRIKRGVRAAKESKMKRYSGIWNPDDDTYDVFDEFAWSVVVGGLSADQSSVEIARLNAEHERTEVDRVLSRMFKPSPQEILEAAVIKPLTRK